MTTRKDMDFHAAQYQNVDLHELANTPGAGKADRALAQAGHPREPSPGLSREYEVDVEYEIAVRRTVTVTAESENQALDRARTLVEQDPGQVAGAVLSVVVDMCSIDSEWG